MPEILLHFACLKRAETHQAQTGVVQDCIFSHSAFLTHIKKYIFIPVACLSD